MFLFRARSVVALGEGDLLVVLPAETRVRKLSGRRVVPPKFRFPSKLSFRLENLIIWRESYTGRFYGFYGDAEILASDVLLQHVSYLTKLSSPSEQIQQKKSSEKIVGVSFKV